MATSSKKPSPDGYDEIKWPFGPRNYLIFGLAMVVIVLGYVALGYGSITLAPVLLVLGYCVLIPVAIIIKGRPDKDQVARDTGDTGTQ